MLKYSLFSDHRRVELVVGNHCDEDCGVESFYFSRFIKIRNERATSPKYKELMSTETWIIMHLVWESYLDRQGLVKRSFGAS